MHLFPSDNPAPVPERFTDPFRYSPHPLVIYAAEEVMTKIEGSAELSSQFAEGKMLGILVVTDEKGRYGYLAAFSGNVGGRSLIDGFVPPIFDLLDPDGHFKIEEAEITEINHRIISAESGAGLHSLKAALKDSEMKRDQEIDNLRARMTISRHERNQIRSEVSDPARLSDLIRESQFEKAELKRLKIRWEEEIRLLKDQIRLIEEDIMKMKQQRAAMSDQLQKWIFGSYIVHNALGEKKSIWEIFSENGLIPPGGTGECAAPKLLEHAYRNGLRPVAMGEFWYGLSPSTAVRTHGHFYPSCTSKCGPLLGFMMKGLETEESNHLTEEVEILHEDEAIVAVEKPSGTPSVPGLDGRTSIFESLKEKYDDLYTVHRLDMDTSGVILFAKTSEAAVNLQKQFENHTIRKTYHARLSASAEGRILNIGDKGKIELPLSPDYDERPRQKVDISQGKEAVTEYEVMSVDKDGTTKISYYPLTGRTHQLRVHSAHILGLGKPIVGDMLYGGSKAPRLLLHACSITFIHPHSGQSITLTSHKDI